MSQDEFNQKVIEHLIALGNRLESIERMLGAESKPEQIKTVDLSKCRENLRLSGKPYARSNCDLCGSLLNPGRKCLRDSNEHLQEPEWRPMSTAPTNGELILARTFRGIDIYVSFDFSALECHWRDTDNSGWSYEDLTGWRPL